MGLDTIMEQDVPEYARNFLDEILAINLPAQFESFVKVYTREALAASDKYTLNAFYSFDKGNQRIDAEQELSMTFNDVTREASFEGKIQFLNHKA